MTETSRVGAHPRTVRPYPPSWIDRSAAWVRRLPGPSWVFYLTLGVGLYLLKVALQWREGVYPAGHFEWFHAVFIGVSVFLLATLHYLDSLAGSALQAFRAAWAGDDAQYQDLHYRLTTLPARPALLATLGGLAYGLLPWNQYDARTMQALKLATAPLTSVVDFLVSMSGWMLTGLFVFHTIHQLRWVSHTLTHHARINLLTLGPLYAFAQLTGSTAVAAGLAFYLYNGLTLMQLADPQVSAGTLVNGVLFSLIAVITFVWPLVGVHRLLVREKARVQAETARHLQRALAELHQRAVTTTLKDMDQLHNLLDSLMVERSFLEKIPTWPWPRETAGLVGSALILPVLLLIIQQVLQRIFGP